jgi:hypothetical protein
MASPMHKPVGKPVGKPVETNLLKLIALQNGLKLQYWNQMVKANKILLNSIKNN